MTNFLIRLNLDQIHTDLWTTIKSTEQNHQIQNPWRIDRKDTFCFSFN